MSGSVTGFADVILAVDATLPLVIGGLHWLNARAARRCKEELEEVRGQLEAIRTQQSTVDRRTIATNTSLQDLVRSLGALDRGRYEGR